MTWSEEVFRIFGQDPARFEPGFKGYWQQVCPDEKPRLQVHFETARTQRSDLDVVHRIVQPDGQERFVRLICQNEALSDGPTTGARCKT